MMKTKHTAGTWSYYHTDDPDWILVMAGGKAGRIVANVNGKSCPDLSSAPCDVVMPAESNARLIAAAPELLGACQAVLRAQQSHRWHVNSDEADPFELVRTALAKATAG